MTERPSHRQTLTNWAYANVVLPLTEPGSYRGLTSKMKALESRERMSLRENQDIQLQDLLKLLKHAQATSPFYRRRFAEAGLDTARMQSFDDLRKIPPLTREDLRVHLREIQSSQFREEDLQSAATGGTTDTPVPILRSSESVSVEIGGPMAVQCVGGNAPWGQDFLSLGREAGLQRESKLAVASLRSTSDEASLGAHLPAE